MQNEINPIFSNLEELKEWLLNVREKHYVELKKAQKLPHDFWESYSAFCNTSGGVIVLGVLEDKPQNNILGVGNPDKTIRNLWDQLSNKNKVSYRSVDNDDVFEYKLDGDKTVILINVKEAPAGKKPVYIGDNLEKTWIRTGDGDRKATKEEIAAFLRNAKLGEDSLSLDNFDIDDLDYDSVLSFKEHIHKRYPSKKYLEMTNDKFLEEIGAASLDRVSKKIKIKRGALLFLGKVNRIREIYPQYHVDYFNLRGNTSRWLDRITDDEPSEYQMNLFNFYKIVYGKLSSLWNESFKLNQDQVRMPASDADETIRECLVNCLAHADYALGYPSVKIEAHDGWFRFLNPGIMLVPPPQFLKGGDSRPRNEIIMKLFRLYGVSERQGFGGPLIYKTAVSNEFRIPEIITDIEHTELKVWNVDLVEAYPELEDEEKVVLQYIVKKGAVKSVRELSKILNISEYKVRKAMSSLENDHHLVETVGKGKATKHVLKVGSMEFITYLEIALDNLKRHM